MMSFWSTRTDPDRKNGAQAATAVRAGEFRVEASDRLSEAGDGATKLLGGAGEIVRSLVISQPALALGAALAAGVVIGWLIKRR